MSVFSIPVTIGVDEEKIAKEIHDNVEEKVVDKITSEVEKIIFDKGSYYRRDSDEPLRNMIKFNISEILRKNEDKIIKLAADSLAEKLSRTKAVKEVAIEVAKSASAK